MNEWGIRAKVILLALIPTTLVAVTMGAYFVATRVQDLDTNVRQRGMTMASYLAQTSEYAVLSANTKVLRRLVDHARDGDKDLLAIAIFDANNQRLAYSGNNNLVNQLLGKSDTSFSSMQEKELENAYLFKAPIYLFSQSHSVSDMGLSPNASRTSQSGDRIVGYVSIYITKQYVTLRQYQTMVTAFIILIVGLITGGILAQNMSRNITSPIIQLANGVRRIKDGQLKIDIETKSSGELGTLVSGFNDMSESLFNAREEMQQAIEQATGDINATNTALEEQNVELNLARKEAIEASRVKSEFLANMSHEIRTPMNGVIGFTNLLLRSKLTEKQKDYLTTIKKSANGLLSIIDDILDFSKIEAGKMEIEQRPLSIADCVDETLNLLAPAAQSKNLEFTGIVYQDVPPHLLGDAGRISQILTNLCNNAIKFTKKGIIEIRVMLEDETPSSVRLKVNVTDSGVGLSKKQQKVLFQAFTQADTTTTRRFGGTGLGLVISKKLAESMNGKIGLESEEGKGSTFWFTLELQKDLDTIEEREIGFPGRKILFHDANRTVQLTTKYLLHRWETDVDTCDSLDELIERTNTTLMQNKSLHLVLVSGYNFEKHAERLNALLKITSSADIPCGFIINSKDEKILQTYTDAGVEHFFSKPVTRKPFYETLYRWLNISVPTVKPSGEPQAGAASSLKPKILCVDDNEANLKLIEAFLNDFTVDAQYALSGEKALELCQNTRFDLIFMDIQMPDMDGPETTSRIRELNSHYKKCPVIAVTAHAMKGERDKLLEQGLDDYLTKPIDQNQLQDTIQKWTRTPVTVIPANHSITDNQAVDVLDLSVDWQLSLKNAGGKDDLARDMLAMLVKSFVDAKLRIQNALDDADYDSLISQVHKLHGATAYCGVPKLKALANDYESHLKQNGIDNNLDVIHKNFMAEMTKVEEDASRILGQVFKSDL